MRMASNLALLHWEKREKKWNRLVAIEYGGGVSTKDDIHVD